MRTLEWIFSLSFVPALLLPFISHTRRQSWLKLLALLPVVVGGIHIFVEGWRIQMIPMYFLAAITLLRYLRTDWRKDNSERRQGTWGRVVMALALVFCIIFAHWLLPVVTLPAPTGPYSVGIVDRELKDEKRGRRLMVSVWYPAAQNGSPAPLTHYPDQVATGLGKLTGLPGFPFQHLRYFKLSASNGVPVRSADSPFPTLVFSHGMVGVRLQNSSSLQELASWGYVVVAIDHTDAAAVTVFPDGETHVYNLERFGITAADGEPNHEMMNEKVFPVWVADQRFVYDMLEKWASDDPLLAGRIDLSRIGSFGHSFGGATALEVCRSDARCRAAANMDGGLYGRIVKEPAVRPLLLMTSAQSRHLDYAVAKWKSLLANAQAPAYWLEVPNSSHLSFTITQLLCPLIVPKGYDPRAGLRITDKYLRTYFDMYLRGIKTTPLVATSGEQDVYWWPESRPE